MPTSTIPETPYEHTGGELAVRALVDRFFDLMGTLPKTWEIPCRLDFHVGPSSSAPCCSRG
jgi:hypothetical protein